MRILPSSLPARLLLLWGLFILYEASLPFDLDPEGRPTLAEGWSEAHKSPGRTPSGARASRTDMAANVMLFLPWGFLAGISLAPRRRSAAVVVVIAGGSALGMSLVVETLQLFSRERISSVTDLLTNGTGGALGGVLAWILAVRTRLRWEPWLDGRIRGEPRLLLAWTVALGTLVWAASPFDFRPDLDSLRAAVKSARPVPFGPPLRGEAPPEEPAKRLAELLAWVLVGGVFARAARERLGPQGRPGAAATGSVLLLAGACELGQLLVASRAADATTVLMAGLGGAVGSAAARGTADHPPGRRIGAATLVWVGATLLAGIGPGRFSLEGARAPGGWHVLPFFSYFQQTNVYALADAVLQILLYAPLGVLLRAGRSTASPGRAFVWGAAVALAVEIGQVFLPARTADITDVVLGGAGATAGARAWAWAVTRRRSGTSPGAV